MAVQKLAPRSLNLEDDFLVVKPTEMVDAINVTVSADDEGNANILKAVQGTGFIPVQSGQDLPSGFNSRVVGSTLNKADNNVYYFVASTGAVKASEIIASLTGGQYVFTVYADSNHFLQVGDVVTITGMANTSRDNGTFIVRTVPTADTFTYVSGAVVPTGTNLVGGSGAAALYGRHSIYCYHPATNKIYLAYRNPMLKFNASTFVKADAILKENGDTILYFTDGVNEPRKINITRALQTRNPGVFTSPLGALPSVFESPSSPTPLNSDMELWDTLICAAKQPPLISPTFTFVTDASLGKNNMYDKYFQFAYQYVYDDGEVSAISPYSMLAVSNEQLLDGFLSEQQKLLNNVIRLTFTNSKLDVAKIRILGRNKNDGQFFSIDEVTNDRALSSTTYDFKNDKSYPYIADSEVNKLYDNVPQKANSQAIAANRLMYGGYTEFYDNVSTNVESFVRYQEKKRFEDLAVVVPNASPVFGTTPARFTVDTAQIGNFLSESDSIDIDINIDADSINVNATTAFTFSYGSISGPVATSFNGLRLIPNEFTINKTLTLNQYTDISTIRTNLASAIQGTYRVGIVSTFDSNNPAVNIGATLIATNTYAWFRGYVDFEVYNYTLVGTNLLFDIKLTGYQLYSNEVWNSSTGQVAIDAFGGLRGGIVLDTTTGSPSISSWTNMRLIKNASRVYRAIGARTFKSGMEHEFGIVYYDNKNRSGGVNPVGPVYVQSYGERENGVQGPASVLFRLKHNPPTWAKRYQFVYAPYTKYNFVIQYTAFEALWQTKDVNNTSANRKDRRLYISAHQFEGRTDSYKDSKGALLDYSFVEGDILRVVKYRSGAGSSAYDIYPKNFEYKIIGYEYYDANNTPFVSDGVGSSNAWDSRKVGWFLALRDEGYAGGTPDDIVNLSGGFWNKNCIVEIIRPVKTTDKPVYREFGYSFAVDNPAPNKYYHRGDRDYRFLPPLSIGTEVLGMRASSDYEVYENDLVEIDGVELYVTDLVVIDGPAGKRWNFSLQQQVVLPGTVITDGIYGMTVKNIENAVVLVESGDTYYRPRQIKISPDLSTATTIANSVLLTQYTRDYIEDNTISDFKDSFAHDFGRPNTIVDNAAQVYRMASVTYSDPYAIDSSLLTLSSFNLSLANFNDYSNKYGAIKYLHSNDDSIFVIQERKSSIVSVGRNLVEYADGSANLAISNNVLGVQNYYAGDYGVNNNPESVVERDGRLYFCDIIAGKVLRLGGDGITPISSNGAGAYIAEAFKTANESGKKYWLASLYDPDKDYYMFSLAPAASPYTPYLTMAYDAQANVWVSRYSFIFEHGQPVGNYLVSFNAGRAAKHSDIFTHGLVYGSNALSSFSVICNENPSSVKVYKSVSQESTRAFTYLGFTRNQQSAVMPASVLTNTTTPITDAAGNTIGLGNQQLREGVYYGEMPRDENSTVSYINVVGQVDSKLDDTITFTGDITNIAFEFGKEIWYLSGSNWVSTGNNIIDILNNKTVKLNTTANSFIPNGATIGVVSEAALNGDPMRDRYIKIDFSSSSTGEFELYAVNVNYEDSKLHFA
jgi:hypothetical protein